MRGSSPLLAIHLCPISLLLTCVSGLHAGTDCAARAGHLLLDGAQRWQAHTLLHIQGHEARVCQEAAFRYSTNACAVRPPKSSGTANTCTLLQPDSWTSPNWQNCSFLLHRLNYHYLTTRVICMSKQDYRALPLSSYALCHLHCQYTAGLPVFGSPPEDEAVQRHLGTALVLPCTQLHTFCRRRPIAAACSSNHCCFQSCSCIYPGNLPAGLSISSWPQQQGTKKWHICSWQPCACRTDPG